MASPADLDKPQGTQADQFAVQALSVSLPKGSGANHLRGNRGVCIRLRQGGSTPVPMVYSAEHSGCVPPFAGMNVWGRKKRTPWESRERFPDFSCAQIR
jgi:hypothetical protein